RGEILVAAARILAAKVEAAARDLSAEQGKTIAEAYKFECAGQSCNAPSRILVARSLYEEFLPLMTEAACSGIRPAAVRADYRA
ncbi:aldehyde dehydrogenase family protein, partial [Mesorhizobium sp. M0571]|uniref:aldehyde dehydrogenase family protein n=1 Tax=Mesorhizobium sp. M0571 TaxID=2956960 RepID=UPI00333CFF6A